MLRMLLSALAAQLMGTVREVEDNSAVAIVKVQSLIRVMDFVTAAIFAAKRGNDTPSENERVLAQLDAQLSAFERDTRELAGIPLESAQLGIQLGQNTLVFRWCIVPTFRREDCRRHEVHDADQGLHLHDRNR